MARFFYLFIFLSPSFAKYYFCGQIGDYVNCQSRPGADELHS
jgi:hypothetical protein